MAVKFLQGTGKKQDCSYRSALDLLKASMINRWVMGIQIPFSTLDIPHLANIRKSQRSLLQMQI